MKSWNKRESIGYGIILAVLILLCACFLTHSYAEDVLSVGDKGEEVLRMKQRLQELRYIKEGSLTKKFTEKTELSLKDFQRNNGLEETGKLDPVTRELLFSDQAAGMPYPTMKPLAALRPLSETIGPEVDAEGFLLGDGEFIYENDDEGAWIYLNTNLQITIRRGEDSSIPLVWFETEIMTRNGEAFRTVMTDPEHPGSKFQYPYVIARAEHFVLGFTDDFYATRMDDHETVGVIIRNGKIISDQTNRKTGTHLPNLDMMAQYSDGRLMVYACNEYTAEELLANGAVNVFSFGPVLLRGGQINEMVYRSFRSIEPRQALGMIEPNHYLLISVQGRTSFSKGTNLQRVAEMMRERGVTEALNLDGGNTMALIFRGRMLNKKASYQNRKFVRSVTSLIGIGYTEDQVN